MMNIFNFLAPIYERLHTHRKTERQIAGMLDLIAPSGQETVLDLGGGTGRLAGGFVGRVRRIIVLDPSEGMLTQAGRKPGVTAVRGCSESLPSKGGVVDLVVCVDAFHHFEDRERSLDEILRVLAHHGRVFFQDFDANRLSTKAMIFTERLLGSRSACYRTLNLRAAFERRGFNAVWESRAGNSYSFLFRVKD